MPNATNQETDSQAIYQAIHTLYVLTDDSDRRVLKQFGLTVPQFNVLMHLELDRAQYLSRIVDRLERDGLVQRTPDGNDRRYVQVTLTPQGEEIRRAAIDRHRASLARRLSALTEDELATLSVLMDKLQRGLQAYLDMLAQSSRESGGNG
jgi:DNA-binding MarR family transcriptional regulator